GVVSVGKSEATILPYLKIAHEHMKETLLLVVLLAVFCVAIVAWWLQQSIALVIRYTGELASITAKPSFYLGRELNELTDAIEDMKHRLENKSYVTDYVHTLTHELKSPLTAIKASGELLADVNLDDEDRQTLSDTINEQSEKLQLLIDRLLLLVKIEQPNFKLASKPINIINLLNNLLLNQQARITKRNLKIQFFHQNNVCDIDELINIGNKNLIMADEFWLTQALNNILDNAIVFAKENIFIMVDSNANGISLQIINDGKLVPEYALDKVFNRYFSLNKKGTGLGLTLAKQVIEHHGGDISINNGEFFANSVVVVAIKI
nr:two-component system sensor histidine kinase CreC [Moraxellaceae bacterium]